MPEATSRCPALIYLPNGCTLRCMLDGLHRTHEWTHENVSVMEPTGAGHKWPRARVTITWEAR